MYCSMLVNNALTNVNKYFLLDYYYFLNKIKTKVLIEGISGLPLSP